MVVKLISLAYVRMAVKRTTLENIICYAVSTNYRSALNYDGRPLHGACVIAERMKD